MFTKCFGSFIGTDITKGVVGPRGGVGFYTIKIIGNKRQHENGLTGCIVGKTIYLGRQWFVKYRDRPKFKVTKGGHS